MQSILRGAGANGLMSGAAIKAAYESEDNTNAFTDDHKATLEGTKLFANVAAVLAFTGTIAAGSPVMTLAEGFSYLGTDAAGHVASAGGQSFDVQPTATGWHVDAFGAVGDGNTSANTGTDNTAAIQKALDVSRGVVVLGASKYYCASGLTVPNNRGIKGQGMGLMNSNHKSVLFTDMAAGNLITLRGYYTPLHDFAMYYTGDVANRPNAVGIKFGDTYAVTRTDTRRVTVQNFGVGLEGYNLTTGFGYFFDNVYVFACITGAHFEKVNNVTFTNQCYIQSCGTGAIFRDFTDVRFTNGCVLEIFGDERLDETLTSKMFILEGGHGFTVRDSYTEIGTNLSAGGSTIGFAAIKDVQGLCVEGNYGARSAAAQIPWIEMQDAESDNWVVRGNSFSRGPSANNPDYLVDGSIDGVPNTAAREKLFRQEIGPNNIKFTMLEKPVSTGYIWRVGNVGDVVADATFSTDGIHIQSRGGRCFVDILAQVTSLGTTGTNNVTAELPVMAFDHALSGMVYSGVLQIQNGATLTDYVCTIGDGEKILRFYRRANDGLAALRWSDIGATGVMRLSMNFPIDRYEIA